MNSYMIIEPVHLLPEVFSVMVISYCIEMYSPGIEAIGLLFWRHTCFGRYLVTLPYVIYY